MVVVIRIDWHYKELVIVPHHRLHDLRGRLSLFIVVVVLGRKYHRTLVAIIIIIAWSHILWSLEVAIVVGLCRRVVL